VSLLAILCSICLAAWVVVNVDRLTTLGFVLFPAAVLILLVSGMDAIQRRFVFDESQVRVRKLCRWKVFDVAGDTTIEGTKSGQVVFRNPDSPKPFLAIPREYNRNDDLLTALKGIYEK
jgi:hypothetical protein